MASKVGLFYLLKPNGEVHRSPNAPHRAYEYDVETLISVSAQNPSLGRARWTWMPHPDWAKEIRVATTKKDSLAPYVLVLSRDRSCIYKNKRGPILFDSKAKAEDLATSANKIMMQAINASSWEPCPYAQWLVEYGR